jgi:predicted  nucleic acid-binding Zn-ribbon protein
VASSEYAQLVEFLGHQFTAIDARFTAIDARFTAIDGRFTAIEHRFTAIDGRFDALDRQLAELRQEMLGHFDEVYRRLERLEHEYQAITQGLRRIEAGLAGELGRREILERDLGELKRQVAALQARIQDIEQRLQA